MNRQCFISLPGRDDAVNLYSLPDNAISLRQILEALSNINRFCGRGTEQISVLNHSNFCYKIAKYLKYPVRYQLGCFCHDFAEAFTGDMIAPIKQLCPEYKEIERHVMKRIAECIECGAYAHSMVKDVDNIALLHEARQSGFNVENWGIEDSGLISDEELGDLYDRSVCDYAMMYGLGPITAESIYKELCNQLDKDNALR